jgi:GNAT superfamily N-acetyltransferase
MAIARAHANPARATPMPAVKVVLRAATSADAPRLAEILIAGRATFMPYAPSVHTDAELRVWVRQQLVPAGGVTVAQRDGAVIGFVVLSQDRECSWIEQMFVHPSHVAKGVGAQLLAHALDVLPAPVRLYTFQANSGARRFYERHGFVAIQMTNGEANEERCPDVLYELSVSSHQRG